METQWLSEDERAAWLRLVAITELLPGVLDAQLSGDADLTHFEYFVLATLSEAPERTLRMSALAQRTNATLPRLSHVVQRLERRALVDRFPCSQDRRATNARLTATGWEKVLASAPGHVETVRQYVLDPLTPTQLAQLTRIGDALLDRLDPENRLGARTARAVDGSGRRASSQSLQASPSGRARSAP